MIFIVSFSVQVYPTWGQVEPQIKPQKAQRPQRVLDLKSKIGLSFLSRPKNKSGLAFQFGLSSSSFMEAIVGGDWRQPENRGAETQVDLAFGTHLQIIQARDVAAMTLGGRFQISYNELCTSDEALCAERSVVSTPTPQYMFELPLRIYWFPVPYISIHSELAVSIRWGKAGATENEIYVPGYSVHLFNEAGSYGQLGLTLWF